MTEQGPDTVEVGRDSRNRPRTLIAVGIVVTLAAAVLGVVRAAGAGHETAPRSAPTPGASTAPTDRSSPPAPRHDQIVPWRDLPPGHPVYPGSHQGDTGTPYDHVSATGSITGTLHRGDRLVFDAVLVSPGIVSLHPCPDYTITFGTRRVTRQLNCTQVPYYASLVRPDGHVTAFRPVLPAGTAVAFRMSVLVPDVPGEQEVVWNLEGPEQTPGFSGIVRVS